MDGSMMISISIVLLGLFGHQLARAAAGVDTPFGPSEAAQLDWGVSLHELQRVYGHQAHSQTFQMSMRALQQRRAWHSQMKGSTHESGRRQQFGAAASPDQGEGLQHAGRDLQAPLRGPHTWPGFFVPDYERHMGMVYAGDYSRLRAALHRHRTTGNLTVVVVGGSISAGAGAVDTHAWVEYLEDWMGVHYNASHDLFQGDKPGRVHVKNSAVPGTFSSYMSVCYNMHVPPEADIIIVEYSLNDEYTLSDVLFDNSVRRPFERLLRKLLLYPNRPAVVLLNAYAWFQLDIAKPNGLFYTGSDREFSELAMYYHLPTLSVKGCCWRLMRNNTHGYDVNRTRADGDGRKAAPELDDQLRGKVFYWDIIHPDGWTGHRVMADLVIQLLMDGAKSLKRRHISPAEAARNSEALPPPMIPGNWESADNKCFIGNALHAVVEPQKQGTQGFTWMNDQPPDKREKWGYVATQPGAKITFRVNTTALATPNAKDEAPGAVPPPDVVSVQIAHLKSYEGMGQAALTCSGGCKCQRTVMDGLHDASVSLVALHEVVVTQAPDCLLTLEVLEETKDKKGGRKVKVVGVMVADEKGADSDKIKGLGVFKAVDYVTDGMQNGTFELRNTWRRQHRRH